MGKDDLSSEVAMSNNEKQTNDSALSVFEAFRAAFIIGCPLGVAVALAMGTDYALAGLIVGVGSLVLGLVGVALSRTGKVGEFSRLIAGALFIAALIGILCFLVLMI